MTSWLCHHPFISCHHCTIGWHILCPNCYWVSPSLSLGICQVSIMFFTLHATFYYALSSSLTHYAPILTHHQTIFLPMMTFPFCSCWFIHSSAKQSAVVVLWENFRRVIKLLCSCVTVTFLCGAVVLCESSVVLCSSLGFSKQKIHLRIQTWAGAQGKVDSIDTIVGSNQ